MSMEAFAQTAVAYSDAQKNPLMTQYYNGCKAICAMACGVSKERIDQMCEELHNKTEDGGHIFDKITVGWYREAISPVGSVKETMDQGTLGKG